ncbi:MAG: glycine cleavage system protein GcvH [Microbacterium sp.]
MTDLSSLKYTAEHEWVALDPSTGSGTAVATVGITDYAADKLGDVVFVELPGVGTGVTANAVVGEIESTKSVGELYAPLTGEVLEVNDAVVADPSLVNSDPYGDGWLVKLTVDAATVADLLDRDAYVALTGGDA